MSIFFLFTNGCYFLTNRAPSGSFIQIRVILAKKKKWYRGILSLYFVKNDQFHKTNTQSNFLYKLFIQNLLLAKHCAGFQADKINILRPVLRKITTVVNFYFSYFSLM